MSKTIIDLAEKFHKLVREVVREEMDATRVTSPIEPEHHTGEPFPILRAIPIEPSKKEWKPEVGNWAWVNYDDHENSENSYHGICYITFVFWYTQDFRRKDGTGSLGFTMLNKKGGTLAPLFFRSLVDADWTGEIGVPMRAYEDELGWINLYFGDWVKVFSKEFIRVALAICEKFNVPIMPWEVCKQLQNGEMRGPK